MTVKVKYLYPLVFNEIIKRIGNKQTTNAMKLALYKIHVQKMPISIIIKNSGLNKSSVYRYESILNDEITYYRSFLSTYNKVGKEQAFQVMFEKTCNRENMDKNLLPALNDIFIKNTSIGTTINKYNLSRATIYRRVKAIESELIYLKKISKLIKNSKQYKVERTKSSL